MTLQAKDVVEGVKKTFIQRLKQVDWMDEATKRIGDEKVCVPWSNLLHKTLASERRIGVI